jgi:hypothetical protein
MIRHKKGQREEQYKTGEGEYIFHGGMSFPVIADLVQAVWKNSALKIHSCKVNFTDCSQRKFPVEFC